MKSALPRAIIVIFCLLISESSFADMLTGTAVRIADGDTITVQGTSGKEIDVRLQGIDAPEHIQAFGPEATANLSRLVSRKTVILDCNGEQTYGRSVCKVLLPNGEDVDLDQVKAGCAWHYKQYAFSQSEDDQAKYGAAEDAAREAHLGKVCTGRCCGAIG